MINIDSIANATKAVLDERFSGYALVGFIAGCDHPVTIIDADRSPVKRMALQTMLQEAAMGLAESAGGFNENDD